MAPYASTVVIDDVQRKRLQGLTRSHTAPYREVQRARIVLAAAHGVSNAGIARLLSISEDTVRTWRDRFVAQGTTGLLDRPRPGQPAVYGPDVHIRIVAAATGELPEAGSDGSWPTWTSNLTGCAAG